MLDHVFSVRPPTMCAAFLHNVPHFGAAAAHVFSTCISDLPVALCAAFPSALRRCACERLFFNQTPMVWVKNYEEKQEELRTKIIKAQTLLPNVDLDYNFRVKISEVCSQLDVDGLRGDIVTNRAAKAYAAYNERSSVTVKDIETIITLCLRHRLRKDPLESIDSGDKVLKVFKEVFEIDD